MGWGSVGRRHLTNLRDLGVDEWVIVRSGQSTLSEEPPEDVHVTSDLVAALERHEPDLAVVASPSSLHAAAAARCAERAVPVLVEKPLAASTDGLDELVTAVERGGGPLLVGFQFRFHPGIACLAELLAAGTLGEVLHVSATWGEHLPDWHPWEDHRRSYAARGELGGGVHHTLCHPFDYLRMLLGPLQVRHAALRSGGPLGLEVAEAADVVLGSPGGGTVVVHLDYWARPARHDLSVVGSQGTVTLDMVAGEMGIWTAASGTWSAREVPGARERNELFIAEAAHLLDLVAGTAEPKCTLDDGLAAVELCEEVQRVAATTNGGP